MQINKKLKPPDRLVGVNGQSQFEAAQLFALAAQDALDPVVPVSQPVRQIHVGQVEVGLRERVRALRRERRVQVRREITDTTESAVWKQTHSFEGAVAGQAVGVQRFRTVLTRRDQLVQNITGVPIVTAAQLLHTGNLHPETCHLLLQGHVHLWRRNDRDTV